MDTREFLIMHLDGDLEVVNEEDLQLLDKNYYQIVSELNHINIDIQIKDNEAFYYQIIYKMMDNIEAGIYHNLAELFNDIKEKLKK